MPAEKVYAEPQRGHVSLGGSLRALLFLVPVGLFGLALFLALRPMTEARWIAAAATEVAFAILWGILVSGVRVAAQWERGVVLRLGRFLKIRGPGILYIIPFIDNVRFVDLRLLTLNIPSQQVITKDNVPAAIDGVLFFLVSTRKRRSSISRITPLPSPNMPKPRCAMSSADCRWMNCFPSGNRFSSGLPRSSSSGSAIGDCTWIPFGSRILKCLKT